MIFIKIVFKLRCTHATDRSARSLSLQVPPPWLSLSLFPFFFAIFFLQFMCWGDRVFPPLECPPGCTFLTSMGVTAPAPVTWAVSPVNWRVGGGCASIRNCAAALSPLWCSCCRQPCLHHQLMIRESQNGGDKILSFLLHSLAGILPPKDMCAWQLLVTGVWSRRGQTCRKQTCFSPFIY